MERQGRKAGFTECVEIHGQKPVRASPMKTLPREPAVTSRLTITHNHYHMSLEDTRTAVSAVSFMAFGDSESL